MICWTSSERRTSVPDYNVHLPIHVLVTSSLLTHKLSPTPRRSHTLHCTVATFVGLAHSTYALVARTLSRRASPLLPTSSVARTSIPFYPSISHQVSLSGGGEGLQECLVTPLVIAKVTVDTWKFDVTSAISPLYLFVLTWDRPTSLMGMQLSSQIGEPSAYTNRTKHGRLQ